jgi:hypothetical protein
MAFSTRFYQADEPFPSMWSLEDDEDDFSDKKEEWAPTDVESMTTRTFKTPYHAAWFSSNEVNNANTIKTSDSRAFREHDEAEYGLYMSVGTTDVELAERCNLQPLQSGEDRADNNNLEYYNISEMKEDDSESWRVDLDDRFESTIRRLADAMRRSQETRVSLAINTPAMARYPRSNSINHVIHSVEESSLHLLSSLREQGQEITRRYSS